GTRSEARARGREAGVDPCRRSERRLQASTPTPKGHPSILRCFGVIYEFRIAFELANWPTVAQKDFPPLEADSISRSRLSRRWHLSQGAHTLDILVQRPRLQENFIPSILQLGPFHFFERVNVFRPLTTIAHAESVKN